MKTLLLIAAAMLMGIGKNALARDTCVIILEVVGMTPAQIAAASETSGTDENGDGEIWMQVGPSTMRGYVSCSTVPGSKHGDVYRTQRRGSDTASADNAAAGKAEIPLVPIPKPKKPAKPIKKTTSPPVQ